MFKKEKVLVFDVTTVTLKHFVTLAWKISDV